MTTTSPQVPLPLIEFDNEEYWKGCKEHKLLLQRCANCKAFRHPPRPMCPHCNSMEKEYVPSSGKGTIYSHTMVRRPTHPAFAEKIPYNVILVELEEGVRIFSNLVDAGEEALKIGTPVGVFFEDVSEDIALPKFKVASSTQSDRKEKVG